ncbi:3-(methylthio)propionyl-CoA ligase [Ampullimonas aquatilis]|uniref:3-(methylthio)propionyl-CoA ligase n=1 Tax=Ampullimonas aquatilis TaxID=1341549 RepID=UPI003C73BB1E
MNSTLARSTPPTVRSPLMGQMMQMPLLISTLLEQAARHYGDNEIVSRRCEGDIHRTTYAQCHERSKRLADALTQLGVQQGDRIGTLAWNGYRHMELYYGVSGMGAICHTINPRLFADQIAFIIHHAEDHYVFFDLTFLPLVESIAARCPKVKGWVLMTDIAHMPQAAKVGPLLCYEVLIDSGNPAYVWPEFDENTASSLCYTSGTTGNPKGVLYSHRSTVLHAYAMSLPDAMSLSASECVMPVVPMFHVNAWGIPYGGVLTGCKLVMPGPVLDGKSLFELMEAEQVSFSAGVPTIWLGLLKHVQENGLSFRSFRRTVVGGAACPPSMIAALQDLGVEVIHAWGMTEMSPLGTLCKLQFKHLSLSAEVQQRQLESQGHGIYGIDMKIVNDDGLDVIWDGTSYGNLLVRGHWVASGYFGLDDQSAFQRDQAGRLWFATGDVATIDADGYMRITDRSKDVIKSGGEWISSITLENLAMGHPAVQEAAVIGCSHEKWNERPVLLVVKKPGVVVTEAELLAFYEGKIARWWLPDAVIFVDSLPHTATGKLLKMALRKQYESVLLAKTAV